MSTATITMPHALVTAARALGHGIAASTHAAFDRIRNALKFNIVESRREQEEAYLAEATDCCDLERRMRDLEHSQRGALTWLS